MLAVLQSLAGRKPTPPTLRYSRYRTNPEVICINQDVPTCFYAVQRRRLPIIAVLLDRGLSDTNTGEVDQIYYNGNDEIFLVKTQLLFLFVPATQKNNKDNVTPSGKQATFLSRIPYGKQATSHAHSSETWDFCCFS